MVKILNWLLELMRQKETTRFIDLAKKRLQKFIDKLPLLPPGWIYEFEQETVYNEDTKTYDCKITVTPRQVYKIKEDSHE